MLKLFRRKKKKGLLDPEARVEFARGKVNEAFNMFHQAQASINESDAELRLAAEHAEQNEKIFKEQAKNEERIKQKALMELELNEKLSKQLEPFLQ